VPDVVRVLTRGPDGAAGKDFLGYVPSAHLCSTVQSGLASLVAQNILEVVDGVRFRQRQVRTGQVAGSRTPLNTCDNGPFIPIFIERKPR